MMRGVLAIRIYIDGVNGLPMADLKMADGVVEHICWVDPKQRKPFAGGINGYTLIYDERPMREWKDWI